MRTLSRRFGTEFRRDGEDLVLDPLLNPDGRDRFVDWVNRHRGGVHTTDPQDLDLTDRSITENTRISYPLDANPNVAEGARGPHPETIILLTADAFGVLDRPAADFHLHRVVAALDVSPELLVTRELIYCVADVINKVGFGMVAVAAARRMSARQWQAGQIA